MRRHIVVLSLAFRFESRSQAFPTSEKFHDLVFSILPPWKSPRSQLLDEWANIGRLIFAEKLISLEGDVKYCIIL